MLNNKNESSELTKDLCQLLKDEGSFVKELTDVATKAACFHARLESIEKALESDPSSYSSKETDDMVSKARDKYSNELENNMKENAKSSLRG
ncbi:hypothetical protein lbkm_1205 [Lachnospiraceae bacterium KM106-2]|nr:hypothetical protein lbkm_1205 [Lachnospiraceae bacterium KM106-2]